jgi:hypothetical protein
VPGKALDAAACAHIPRLDALVLPTAQYEATTLDQRVPATELGMEEREESTGRIWRGHCSVHALWEGMTMDRPAQSQSRQVKPSVHRARVAADGPAQRADRARVGGPHVPQAHVAVGMC